jgi:quinol monooxygenase YgiN
MIVLIVHLKVKPGTESECIRLMHLLEEQTRKEAGCIQYVGHQSTEDPTRFAFYESYVSEAALHLHWATEHFKHYVTEGLDKIVEERTRYLMKPIS